MMIRPRNKWGFRRGGPPTRPCRSSAKVSRSWSRRWIVTRSRSTLAQRCQAGNQTGFAAMGRAINCHRKMPSRIPARSIVVPRPRDRQPTRASARGELRRVCRSDPRRPRTGRRENLDEASHHRSATRPRPARRSRAPTPWRRQSPAAIVAIRSSAPRAASSSRSRLIVVTGSASSSQISGSRTHRDHSSKEPSGGSSLGQPASKMRVRSSARR